MLLKVPILSEYSKMAAAVLRKYTEYYAYISLVCTTGWTQMIVIANS